jgi:hypothetical protein
MVPSLRVMLSFGELSRLPCQRSATVMMVPSAMVRDTRRLSPSLAISRPCGSSPSPLALPVGARKTVTVAGGRSSSMVSAPTSENSSTPCDAIHTGPSVNVNPPPTFSTSPRPISGFTGPALGWLGWRGTWQAAPEAETTMTTPATAARKIPLVTR